MRASADGVCFRSRCVVALCCPNGLDTYRVGFTASKRVGNAVIRNKSKRRLRAATDIVIKANGQIGYDYVFIAKSSTHIIGWGDLLSKINQAISFFNNTIRNT